MMRGRKEQWIVEALAAHADELNGRPGALEQLQLTDEQRSRLVPLFRLTERLRETLVPVRASPAFIRDLGKELVEASAQRSVLAVRRYRRAVLVGAAALGSAVSVIAAVVLVVLRMRARARAHATR